MKLNVGASQKISDNHYGSRGASVNLEIELDSGLVTDPAKLQERIRHLFGLVRHSVSEELNASRNGPSHPPPIAEQQAASPNSHQPSGTPRLATSKQVKALYAIAKQRGFDLREVVRDRYGIDRPEEFTIKQASDLITALKSADESLAA